MDYGGQGVVLAGVLLGEAGVIDGKFVAGSNSDGAQARGSGCKSEIVFSNEPIDFPHLVTADIFVALSQGAYSMGCGDVRETSGLILYDRGQRDPQGGAKGRSDRNSCDGTGADEVEEQAGGKHCPGRRPDQNHGDCYP